MAPVVMQYFANLSIGAASLSGSLRSRIRPVQAHADLSRGISNSPPQNACTNNPLRSLGSNETRVVAPDRTERTSPQPVEFPTSSPLSIPHLKAPSVQERWIQEKLAPSFVVEFTPPKDFAARVAAARERAGDRQLLLVLDSLQKLPMDLEDRRAGVDAWIRLLERLRHEHEAAVLLISEIKRDQKGQYTAHEAAFKDSSGIEYAADLAMTLTRPTAGESAEARSTLRVELARDCDDDPRGEVAGYCPLFPFYGLEEVEPERRQAKRRNGATSGERSNHDKPATAPACVSPGFFTGR